MEAFSANLNAMLSIQLLTYQVPQGPYKGQAHRPFCFSEGRHGRLPSRTCVFGSASFVGAGRSKQMCILLAAHAM